MANLIIRSLVLSLLALSAAAQQVKVTNFSQGPWEGWFRATVDAVPQNLSGHTSNGFEYHVGRRVGPRAVVVDIRAALPHHREIIIDLGQTRPAQRPIQSADADLATLGEPNINGIALEMAPTSVGGRQNPLRDGAAYVIHWRGRPIAGSPMFHADVWVTFYPMQSWAVGEVVITASNPTVPDVRADVPAGGITLGWSNALCLVDALPAGQPILREGDYFADGQARSYRFVLGYLGKMGLEDVRNALAVAENAIVANGILFPGLLGAPADIPEGFNASSWVANHWQAARQRIHSWDAGPIGVAANSGQTGAQEDQGFGQGHRAYAFGGRGTEVIRYYAALGQSRRPMHHLEPNGDHLSLTGHPGLVMWSARAHWHRGVSPDQLGKSESLQPGWRTHNWNGPDREHWFINTLCFAVQVTASPALQWQLEHHARIVHYQETIDPRLSTSRPDAARSQGWAGIVCSNLWTFLEDRSLALMVMDRFQARFRQVYLPHYEGNAWQLWDVQQDPRVTQYVDTSVYPNVTMAYQAGFATMGVELAGQTFNMPRARQEAYEQARKIIDSAYERLPNGSFREWEIVGIRSDGTLATQLVEGVSAHRTGWYGGAWLPCAAWVVLQHEPDNQRAQAIYRQATSGNSPNAWMPPLR